MVFKALFLTAGTLAASVAGYGALAVMAPNAAATIESFVRNQGLGWNEAACAANPVGCLSNRYDKLSELERATEANTRATRAQFERISSLVSEQEMVAAKNTAFLEQGRVAYREHEANPARPIQFAGRTYPGLDVFRSQLELLFDEKTALDRNLDAAQALKAQLKERLDGLMIHAGQIALAKRMIPAQLQLVKANRTLADFGASVAMVDGVIRGSEAGIDQTEQLIRTTRDLMTPPRASVVGAPRAASGAFESFLRN
ncbi:hypothetical protein [Xanthobacter wiegelii]|uniref:hypothetical protein n=1 Tax=Xanthobacter wiegelii TaxID=3119913 RepID=UPI00372CCB4E